MLSNRLSFDFGSVVSAPRTSTPRGGSVEFFKGHNMVYDRHNKFICNIKHKRYVHLTTEFKKYHSIDERICLDETDNFSISNLWHEELEFLIRRNWYKNKKNDLLKHTAVPTDMVNGFCEVLALHNLENFTPFNVPINTKVKFLSKYDYCFGSIEHTSLQHSFVNTAYSVTNIKKLVKRKNIMENNMPVKNVMCIPILPNVNINDIISHDNILCIIPENSIVLQSSDHWYDIEYNKVLNAYPIAVCMFCNEIAQEINPLTKHHYTLLEDIVNKQLIVPNSSVKINESIIPVEKISSKNVLKTKPIDNSIEVIYTDASIRTVNNNVVSGIGVWFRSNNKKHISKQIIQPYKNDINYCELVAIYVAIINATTNKTIHIYTDSFTAMNLLKEGYSFGSVKNKKYHDIVMKILHNINRRSRKIKIFKVKAHVGDVGNSNADLMARLGVYNTSDTPIRIRIDNTTNRAY